MGPRTRPSPKVVVYILVYMAVVAGPTRPEQAKSARSLYAYVNAPPRRVDAP